MSNITQKGIDFAKHLMKEIMYCSGRVMLTGEVYEDEYVNLIAPKAEYFFECNPELYNDDDIMTICDGEDTEVQEKYGNLEGYKELHEVLDKYFNGE